MSEKNDIKALSKKIEDYRKRNLNEASTKNGFIEPLFKVIGWDFADVDSVEPEFPVFLEGENKPVDYALKFERKPCLFLEAKRINENIDVAKKDGMKKAVQEKVPWVIATNGDSIAVLMIDESIPEEEREVFQVTLSDSVHEEQTLSQFIAYLQLLTPEAIQSGVLRRFAEQKLKETRVTNVLKNTLYSDEFRTLLQENFSESYPDDNLDQDVLDKIMEKIKIGEEIGPTIIEHIEDPNSTKFQNLRKKLFQYPGKAEKKSIERNIIEKRELWLQFIERKRMSSPEFKDLWHFKQKGVAGFCFYLTYWGLATNDGDDKVRGGKFFKINDAIIPEIKAILKINT
ncbi:MAG: hypothetical protein FJ128_02075 [Deltaproteobacteria bacterium]|nr:hypothetical protein [Deltaproteobacteria bacterium]